MIRREIIEQLGPEEKRQALVALATIHLLGLIPMEKAELLNGLALGPDDEPAKELAKQVLALRKRINLLTDMETICEQAAKEMNNA